MRVSPLAAILFPFKRFEGAKNLTNNEGKRSRTDEQLPNDFHGETTASRYAVTRLHTIVL